MHTQKLPNEIEAANAARPDRPFGIIRPIEIPGAREDLVVTGCFLTDRFRIHLLCIRPEAGGPIEIKAGPYAPAQSSRSRRLLGIDF
jgi:hypothetical protein